MTPAEHLLVSLAEEELHHGLNTVVQGEWCLLEIQHPRFDLREVEDVIENREQPLGG